MVERKSMFNSVSECISAMIGATSILQKPERILKSDTATIVFWTDGTKTVVRRSADEPDNEYTAFTAALAKKVYGSNNAIKKIIKTKTEVQKPKNDNN